MIPSSENVYSAAPSMFTLAPTLTSPKKGPAAVPAKVQKNDARGVSISADSHVSRKSGKATYQ